MEKGEAEGEQPEDAALGSKRKADDFGGTNGMPSKRAKQEEDNNEDVDEDQENEDADGDE